MKKWSYAAFAAAVLAIGPAAAQTYLLPFKGEDFRDDERVLWGREIHSPSGVQKYGFDLDVRRYDADGKSWKWAKADDKVNSNWYVYGRRVYAMRAGKVIACWRNAPENIKAGGSGAGFFHEELTKHPNGGSRIYGGGNGFWIEHDDGSRAEYAHFRPGTVPNALCPHDDALLPSVIASPAVENAWPHIRVRPRDQRRVEAGQFLGEAGNAGTSTGPHLHVHAETGGVAAETKSGGSPVEMKFKSGLFLKTADATDPYVEWKSFAGKPMPSGPMLFWPSRSKFAEYGRHGLSSSRFGAIFQHLADSGYAPEWIDAYSVAGKSFINTVWRPATAGWRAYFLATPQRYQDEFDRAKKDGYSAVFVESSLAGGAPRYTVVFEKNAGDAYARHGLNYDQHMSEMDKAKGMGLSPANVSVVSTGGDRRYTVLYRKKNIGSWSVKSQIAEADYQKEYDDQTKAGRKPLYLNAYVHGGKPYISAVFGAVSTPARKDRHAMSAAAYQEEYESALKAGLKTRAVTAFDGAASAHRFAAAWWK